MLRIILRKKEDNDLIFGNDDVVVKNVRQYNEQTLVNYCKKVGLAQKYENSPRFKISSHSFRAYFITKISRHDENFAKKLTGQKGYLLQYDRLNDQEKLEKYIEFEHDLTIYDDERMRLENEKLKVENTKQDVTKLKEELWDAKFELMEMIDDAIEEPAEFKKMIKKLREEKYQAYENA